MTRLCVMIPSIPTLLLASPCKFSLFALLPALLLHSLRPPVLTHLLLIKADKFPCSAGALPILRLGLVQCPTHSKCGKDMSGIASVEELALVSEPVELLDGGIVPGCRKER